MRNICQDGSDEKTILQLGSFGGRGNQHLHTKEQGTNAQIGSVFMENTPNCCDVQTVYVLLCKLIKVNNCVTLRSLFTYDQSNSK
jgi:hypothetical protein